MSNIDRAAEVIVVSASTDAERWLKLSAELKLVEARLIERASEFYRQESGRTHFHRLQLIYITDQVAHFTTPIRDWDVEIDVPIEWFVE